MSGIREYRTGDPFSAINFKATAKSGELRVNVKDSTSSKNYMLYLNVQINESMWINVSDTGKIERGLSYAAAMVKDATRQGIKTGFGANCENNRGGHYVYLERQGGYPHLKRILEEMAKLEMKMGVSFSTLLNIDIRRKITNTEIFILASYLSEHNEAQIHHLRKMGNTVNIIKL